MKLFWCPWCEAVIKIDGELATRRSEAYWHAYDHRYVAPYAVDVEEEFEELDTVNTDQEEI